MQSGKREKKNVYVYPTRTLLQVRCYFVQAREFLQQDYSGEEKPVRSVPTVRPRYIFIFYWVVKRNFSETKKLEKSRRDIQYTFILVVY